ncbi:DMT family transporter [Roseovarius rhodophyticola]|uniref:DMT family transporter n=1 Tax=Roseovarius rhodophyticola TaxID=3080827 RepID=A0ABZ2TBZ8_9RHOB|nr:DMT family transporter [Roseovarius sp. W115]MDV2930948.1 DMT family transporter [Roseovarius sp. W115]
MTRPADTSNWGIAFMVAAMIVLPFGDALSKLLVQKFPPEQITWMRNLFHFGLLLPVIGAQRKSFDFKELLQPFQVTRGLCFVAMTVSYVAALIWMPLTDALAIVFLFPLIVTGLSWLALGEHVRSLHWGAVVLGFGGALLVIQPGIGTPNIGWLFALFAAFCTAIYVVLTRKMSHGSSSLLLLVGPAAIGSLILAPVMLVRWVQPTLWELFLMASVGGLAALTHFLIILAYARAAASIVAPFSYVQILGATALGALMFQNIPDAVTVLGLGIIVASGLLVSLSKQGGEPHSFSIK